MNEGDPIFAYSAGPVHHLDHLNDLLHLSSSENIPAVLNRYVRIDPSIRKKFERIRASYQDEFDPKLSGSLDKYILKQDSRQAQDYRLALANHFENVLDSYKQLDSSVILVPGPYDLDPREMARFNQKFDLGVDEERFAEDAFPFSICDTEITTLPGGERLLGIGGTTGFESDLPDIVQHADFYLLTRTNWKKAAEIVGKDPDYLVSSAGLSGTFDPDRYSEGTFDIFNRKLSASKLVLDPCPDQADLHHLTDVTGGRPLIHGNVVSFDWTVHVVCQRPEDEEYKFSIRVHDGREPVLEFGYRPGQWDELELPGSEDPEQAEEEDVPSEVSDEEKDAVSGVPVERMKKWMERQDPNLLVLVSNPDEFVEILQMRLFDKADYFHVLDDCAKALEHFQELNPSFVILEDQLEGSDAFLRKLKSDPRTGLVSIIKIYDEGRDPESEPVDFRVQEDKYLVEPFEMMELFALIESELVRYSEQGDGRVHEMIYRFRNADKNLSEAERLGNQLIRNLSLDHSSYQGLRSSFQSHLKEAVQAEQQLEERSPIRVDFHLSSKHLTLTVEVEGGEYIKSMSEKMDSFPPVEA